jgi:hypothetical protein
MALEVKKIYVDSRHRTPDSVSDSNFRIQLGRNIFLPEKCIYHLENCVIPHSWYNIESGINDTMYYLVNGNDNYITAKIPSTNYTGSALATALTSVLTHGLTASYDLNTNKITITSPNASTAFIIITDHQLLQQYNITSPNSCNDIITNRTAKLNTFASPWVSGMLNLQGFRSLYISSSTLSNYDTLGPQGENSIIKKIITNADFGYLIVDHVVSDHDYLGCSRMTLNTIDFQIRDVRGNLIPLHDSPVSFTIVFTIAADR